MRMRWGSVRMKSLGLIGVALVWAIALAAPARAYVDGSDDACVDFTVSILQFGDPDYSDGIIDVSNEGWAGRSWVATRSWHADRGDEARASASVKQAAWYGR